MFPTRVGSVNLVIYGPDKVQTDGAARAVITGQVSPKLREGLRHGEQPWRGPDPFLYSLINPQTLSCYTYGRSLLMAGIGP